MTSRTVKCLAVAALAAVLLMPTPAQAQSRDGAQPASPGVVTLPPDLERVLRDYETAWHARDAARLASLFDENGMVMSPMGPLVRGRAAIEHALTGRGGPLTLRPISYAAQDTVAFIVGVFGSMMPEPTGRFVLSLRRSSRAEPWLIVADIDNSHMPVHPGAAMVRRMFDDVWSAGDYTALPELLAPGFRFNFRGRAMPMDTAAFRGMVTSWRTAFPDLRFTVHDVVIDGNRAAARLTFTGTHSAPMFGIAATGRAVTVTMMAFVRFEGGRMAEMWEDYDEHALRQQLTRQAP
ncbi:MAG TPA: ester cyclase [Longimicrobiales bacterium]|nr:ester cyclase [Longimicrobiales bacterium]